MTFRHLTQKQDEFLSLGIPGNDCIVLQDGKTVFRRFSGYSDLEKHLPMTGRERFMMYSLSKPLTCSAALQLWEKGLFQLDDPLYLYLPEFKDMTVRTKDGIHPAENRITIRHLFTMTAGFSYNTASPSLRLAWDKTHGSCETREVMKYLAKEPLLFDPGTRWEYSFCHDVLAVLIQVVSGQKFQEYVRDHIFNVLGMDSATYLLPASEIETLPPLYEGTPTAPEIRKINPMEDPARLNIYRLGADYASGGAGLVCTLEDYAKFADSLSRDERVLKRDTIALMSTDQLSDSVAETTWLRYTDYGYGLGVRCPRRGYTTHEDFGWTSWAGAYLAIIPERKLALVYVQHVRSSIITERRDELLAAMLKDLGL